MDQQVRESELVEGFLRGDGRSHELVRSWIDTVLGLRCWHQSIREAGADIRQEVMLTLTENLRSGKYRGEGLKTYVSTITKYTCLRHYRSPAGGESRIEEPNSMQDSALDEMISKEDRSLIRSALRKLDEKCRKMLALRFYKSLSHRAMAATFDITEGTSRQWLKRCLDQLRGLVFVAESL